MRDPEKICRNLYTFVRLRLGDRVSDREIARNWGMPWKSFTVLKSGQRQVPRINELEKLARLLEIDAAFVFEVARGVSARKVHKLLQENDREKLSELLMTGIHNAHADAEAEDDRYRAILDRLSEGVFTVDLQGNFKDVNHGLTKVTDYSRGELLKLSLFDLLSSSETPKLMETLALVYNKGEKRDVELEARTKSGVEIVLDVAAARMDDDSGDALGIQGIARDITASKRLELERTERYTKLQAVFDAIPGVCMLDAKDGTILLANRLLYAIAKKREDEVIGRKIWQVFGVEEDPDCPILHAAESGQVEEKIVKLTDETGRDLYFHRTAYPLIGDGGKVEQVVEIAMDVTDRICAGDPKLLALWRSGDLPEEGIGVGDIEKRRFVRVPLDDVVEYRTDGRSAAGRGRNLARSGMFIETDEIVPVGTTVTLEWSLLEGGTITGVVTWNTEERPGPMPGMGIEFTDLNPVQQNTIIDHVLRTAKEEPRESTAI